MSHINWIHQHAKSKSNTVYKLKSLDSQTQITFWLRVKYEPIRKKKARNEPIPISMRQRLWEGENRQNSRKKKMQLEKVTISKFSEWHKEIELFSPLNEVYYILGQPEQNDWKIIRLCKSFRVGLLASTHHSEQVNCKPARRVHGEWSKKSKWCPQLWLWLF